LVSLTGGGGCTNKKKKTEIERGKKAKTGQSTCKNESNINIDLNKN
jgi:hypothetical protein